ncbi:CheR family methyltransferase [Devosia sp. Leaf64]|uniref:CheR family methyltransferase n=1 Tax=Devosia sp. Leaf64 TaxID=1736229 RepID=UPI0007133AB8|nr:CheR family methyltransferase [Devosia sp. Leaf64]KQN72433.1 chemotaxis protein CheR [Devosia sp. Leaf64]
MQFAQPTSFSPQATVDQLSHRDFTRIVDLIGAEIGVRLHSTKQSMVEARLRRRLRDLQMTSFAEYSDLLFRRAGLETELPHLVNVLTTNKTDFFREPQHFDLLRSTIVKDLLASRRMERLPTIKVWSAACSTGAEAYTTAMVLANMAEKTGAFRYSILGTDVSTEVLQQARIGIYPTQQIAPVPQDMQFKYLLWSRREAQPSEVRIVPELRRHTNFNYLNLMDQHYPVDRDVDVIFLRNVLIYFSKDDQAKVIDKLVSHLRPGGYLLLGHSEPMAGKCEAVRQVATATFQKI